MNPASRISTAALLAIACGGTTSSRSPGDDVRVDVDATASPPVSATYADAGGDSPFAPLDGPFGVYGPHTYAGVTICQQCACPAGTYCFGGGTGHTQFSGVCDETGSASGLEVGCEPLPGACGNEPDCACLFAALAPRITCLPVCAEPAGGAFIFYCPVP